MTKKSIHNQASIARLKWRRRIMLALIIVLFSCAYFYRAHLTLALAKPTQTIKNWMKHSTTRLHQNLKQAKQVIQNESPDQPIHFEFYKTLPSMQMNVKTSEDTRHTGKPEQPAPSVRPSIFKIVTAESLEKEFSEHLKEVKSNKNSR